MAASLPRRQRKWLVACLAFLLALGLVEGLARTRLTRMANGLTAIDLGGTQLPLLPFQPSDAVLARWLEGAQRARYVVPDPELGWTIAASTQAEAAAGPGRRVLYTSNEQGFRAEATRVYTPSPAEGRLRVVACGDSFTFGAEVELSESWPARLESEDPRIEAINLGVLSYGVDQAYLRWRRDGQALESDAVLLCIWPEDLCRDLNVLRYFLAPTSGYLMAKPRFVLENGELTLVATPVPGSAEVVELLARRVEWEALEYEHWYEPTDLVSPWYHGLLTLRTMASARSLSKRKEARARLYSGEDPAAIDLAVAIAQRFASEVRASGATALVVVMPMPDFFAAYGRDGSFPLVAALRAAGIETLDLLASFAGVAEPGPLFQQSEHLSPQGNAYVAREVAGWLGSFPQLR